MLQSATRVVQLSFSRARFAAPLARCASSPVRRRVNFAPLPALRLDSPSLSFSTTANAMSAPHPVHSTAVPADLAANVPADAAGTAAAAAAPGDAAQPPKGAAKEKKPKKGGDLAQGMASLELNPPPEYLASRVALFERLKKEADEVLACQSPPCPSRGNCSVFQQSS